MAWNEPGNSGDKDKDPWGKRRGEQRPAVRADSAARRRSSKICNRNFAVFLVAVVVVAAVGVAQRADLAASSAC